MLLRIPKPTVCSWSQSPFFSYSTLPPLLRSSLQGEPGKAGRPGERGAAGPQVSLPAFRGTVRSALGGPRLCLFLAAFGSSRP